MSWTLAQRAHRMNPSVIREILKVTERPGIISFAGGLPSPETFPVDAFAAACESVLRTDGRAALQYAASEGLPALREWIARQLPWAVHPDQVLITTGSQQGLDLVAKVLIDAGSTVLVETPTYLGALQAFTPMEPMTVSVDSDDEGIVVADLEKKAPGARFLYVLPNFQNPTGRTLSEARRQALVDAARAVGLPIVEDNPYGELWFHQPPPQPLTARHPEGCIYLGSFSKVLAPGLRLGYMVAPKAISPKLLQAKQAADLHSPSFNQRMVAEVLKDGFIDRHVPTIRALYKAQCHAMLDALRTEMAGLDVVWNSPDGGMFLWARLPEDVNAVELLPQAVDRGVAFVPGAAFYADHGDPRTLRLSFVTSSEQQIRTGVRALAQAIREAVGAEAVLRVWGRLSSINVRKVVLCAQVLGLDFERIDAGMSHGVVNTPAYRAKNPNGLVPLLEDGDFTLWESNAIIRYLCCRKGSALYPQELRQRFDAERWMDWQQTTLNRAGGPAFVQLIRTPEAQRDPAAIAASVAATEPLFAQLDAHLARQPFMAGDALTMADVPIACEVHRWWGLPLPRPAWPHLERWYARWQAMPASCGVLDLHLS